MEALAIRDKSIYVLRTPEAVAGPVSIYLDLEGKPDEGFVYFIGMVIVKDGEERRLSLLADDRHEEALIFERFLDQVEALEEFHLFCYGGYVKAFLNRMRKRTERVDLADRVIKSLSNTLSSIYTHFYYPSYSNGLKDVARCLGFEWTGEGASGIQSVAWRMKWETTRGEEWKRRLITYNMEDSLVLKMGEPLGLGPDLAEATHRLAETRMGVYDLVGIKGGRCLAPPACEPEQSRFAREPGDGYHAREQRLS